VPVPYFASEFALSDPLHKKGTKEDEALAAVEMDEASARRSLSCFQFLAGMSAANSSAVWLAECEKLSRVAKSRWALA
jgi:hypothetical protein